MTELIFLGTGNFLAPPGRYWNSFVMDASVLVEPSPTALPHLRRCGFTVDAIEVVVVSHFHADHCFGWPFFLQAAAEPGGGRTLYVVGPPGIEAHLENMNEAGAVRSVTEMARTNLDLRFVEVDGTWQEAGPLRFRAVEVDARALPALLRLPVRPGGQTIAYSGDTTPVRRAERAGPRRRRAGGGVQRAPCTAGGAAQPHGRGRPSACCRAAHPGVQLVLTHLGEQVDTGSWRA